MPGTFLEDFPRSPTSNTTAAIAFRSAGSSAGFRCSLDGAAYRPCESPKRYDGPGAGRHLFKVSALDASGNADRTPASRSWTVVEGTAPAVKIEGAPRIESYHEYHYFRFSADVPGSGFYCSLDDGPFEPCASGAYRYVPYGKDTFRVHAVGPDGTRGEAAVVEYESRDPNWD